MAKNYLGTSKTKAKFGYKAQAPAKAVSANKIGGQPLKNPTFTYPLPSTKIVPWNV